jgi:hypothetical protein
MSIRTTLVCLVLGGFVVVAADAQGIAPSLFTPAEKLPSAREFVPDAPVIPQLPIFASCSTPEALHSPNAALSSRACYYADRLLKPGLAIRGALYSSWGALRGDPYEATSGAGSGSFTRRFGTFYAEQGARAGGELIAGYLNHERLSNTTSNRHGFWSRTGDALESVLVTQDDQGRNKLALVPLAGSMAAGLTAANSYGRDFNAQNTLTLTAGAYGTYFARALYREFRPEIRSFAARHLPSKLPGLNRR